MEAARRGRGEGVHRDLHEKTGSEASSEMGIGESTGWKICSRKKKTKRNEKDDPISEAVEIAVSMTKMNRDKKKEFFVHIVGKA